MKCMLHVHCMHRHLSLFEHADVCVAPFLNTSQHSLLGRYVRICYFHRRYLLRNPPIDISMCFRAWAQQAWLSHAVD